MSWVKPTGRLEIDWSNPITKDIASCIVFDEQGVFRDLITGDILTAGSDVSSHIGAPGIGADFGGTVANNNIDVSSTLAFSGTDPISMYSISSPDASGGQMALIGAHDNYNSWIGYENPFNATTSFLGLTPSLSNAPTTWVDGDVYHIMGTYGPSANITTYVGAEATGAIVSNAAATTGTYTGINGIVLGRLNTDAVAFNGKMYLAITWRREVPEHEFAALFLNPNQIFIDDDFVGMSAAVAGDTTVTLGKFTSTAAFQTLNSNLQQDITLGKFAATGSFQTVNSNLKFDIGLSKFTSTAAFQAITTTFLVPVELSKFTSTAAFQTLNSNFKQNITLGKFTSTGAFQTLLSSLSKDVTLGKFTATGTFQTLVSQYDYVIPLNKFTSTGVFKSIAALLGGEPVGGVSKVGSDKVGYGTVSDTKIGKENIRDDLERYTV